MHNQSLNEEKQAQFEKDKAAYETLSPDAQQSAAGIANIMFKSRRVFVGFSKSVLMALEGVFDVLFVLPYVFLKHAAAKVANGLVRGIQWGVHAGAACARSILPSGRGDEIFVWEKKAIAKIDTVWQKTKETLHKGVQKTKNFLEYYGALGLYRGTEWILNPRTSSGKPLLGNEKLNKTVGTLAGVCLFGILVFQLSKAAVLAKVWHVKLAHSMVTDTAPLYIKLIKQGIFHPLLTIGVTAAKFFALPVIAASRQALKSTPFAQGIAYQYNTRLRSKPENVKTRFNFVQNFVNRIIQAASPEFYRARLKHYQGKPPPCLHPEEAAGNLSGLELTDAFEKAQETPPSGTVPPKNAIQPAPGR